MRATRTILTTAVLLLGLACVPAGRAVSGEGERQPLPHGRLYPGAPPVIPHPLTGDYESACLDCHEEGGDLGLDNPVPRTSHPERPVCRQCHVPSDGSP